jgi:predicted nuclease of predicted toxin-antitoxin system
LSTPRFLADEDLNGNIVAAVRRMEPAVDLLTVVEAGRSGIPDIEILDFAEVQQRILVSHDVITMKATAERRIAAGVGITGLLLASQDKPTKDVAESLLLIWAATEADEWRDRIVFLPF